MRFVLAAAVLVLAFPAPAAAHGERTQEAFVRSSTVLLYDVSFSTVELAVGESVTVTGFVRVMESWPDHVVPEPEVGFLSLAMPGPVFAIKDRRLGGEFMPQSVHIGRGLTYAFSVTAVAREEGRFHVHPSFSVQGTGTLVGRGEWITVGPGVFVNTVELADGSTVELTSYGFDRVVLWHGLCALVGFLWVLYWMRQPLLARSAAVRAGEGRGLIGRRDQATGIAFLAVVLIVLSGGYVVTRATLPSPLIPLQVSRLTPSPVVGGQSTVETHVTRAEWRPATDVLWLSLNVHNSGPPVRLTQLQIAELTVPVDVPVGPGPVELVVPGTLLREYNLLPLDEPQVRVTALLFYTDVTGARTLSEIDELAAPILPARR